MFNELQTPIPKNVLLALAAFSLTPNRRQAEIGAVYSVGDFVKTKYDDNKAEIAKIQKYYVLLFYGHDKAEPFKVENIANLIPYDFKTHSAAAALLMPRQPKENCPVMNVEKSSPVETYSPELLASQAKCLFLRKK